MEKKFKTVAVGGTFEEFHRGHRALILKAFEVGDRVLIGLSTDEFAEKLRKNHDIEPYEERLRELTVFLERNGLRRRAEILPLEDPYGVTVTNGEIEAIIVSRETEPRAHRINEIRVKKGLRPLKVVAINMVPAEDHVTISSTRIRIGEIDREGRLVSKRDI
ncbi:MAG: phosphopantetheine adenylyltransferase [Candidatus Bathyarchaeota archaeon]|nr:phosphopantetheine adenylyltransferase [Candidatus Bathyarchaeota archaeon]